MDNVLQPLGEKAWLSCKQTNCGDVHWLATWQKDVEITGIRQLDSLTLTGLNRGDYVELTISGYVHGKITSIVYYAHPDVHLPNQPIDLQSQSDRCVSNTQDTQCHTMHGMAMFRASAAINSSTEPKSVRLCWYLEGIGTVTIGYTIVARILRGTITDSHAAE